MNLYDLKEGQSAFVKTINLKGAIRRRVLDLGLIEGTKVRCVLISASCDPIAYRIRGALIALRRDDAEKIEIESSDELGA